MSRARHKEKHRAAGGKVVAYAGGESNVMKEAHERKRGGRVHHEAEGEKAKERHDRKGRARGGRMHTKGDGHTMHHEHGEMHAHEKHTPKRARGGAVGADKRPLSSAANIKEVTKGESKEDMGRH